MGRSSLRSDPLGQVKESGKLEVEEVEEWRAGRQMCGESAGWGAMWAW